MGARNLAHDDANMFGPGVDGMQHRGVHLVHHGADLACRPALGDGHLDEWHRQLRIMNGSGTGPSSVLIQTLLSRVYSLMVSAPCSTPTPLLLNPWRGDIGDMARYVLTQIVPASSFDASR